ncbi:MAG: hypothetical protein JKY37_07520, partial [Nannocystaceae bacterium]|nr:hypothetical protein [Nannocystaceae bacterium]
MNLYADHIPFLNTETDRKLVAKFYSDSECVRVPLSTIEKVRGALPSGPKLWLDATFDGFPDVDFGSERQSNWAKSIQLVADAGRFSEPNFLAQPDESVVAAVVSTVLADALAHAPDWLSIPQLPHLDGVDYNKINRSLARAAAKFLDDANFRGTRILPVVFTHQRQLNQKTQRNAKIKLIEKLLELAGARSVWAVDSSLADQSATAKFETERFPGIIAFHAELRDAIELERVVAGPYWGLNLVLWARELVD